MQRRMSFQLPINMTRPCLYYLLLPKCTEYAFWVAGPFFSFWLYLLLYLSAGVKLWSQQVSRHCGWHCVTEDPRTLPTQTAAGGRLAGMTRTISISAVSSGSRDTKLYYNTSSPCNEDLTSITVNTIYNLSVQYLFALHCLCRLSSNAHTVINLW